MLLTTRKLWLLPLLLVALLVLAACGGDDDDDPPTGTTGSATNTGASADPSEDSTVPPGEPCDARVTQREIESQLRPIVLSSDLALGENRFQVGMIDQATQLPVAGANLHFKFICYDTEDGTEAFETDATAVSLTRSYTHTHDDGFVESHEAGETGVYIANVEFDRPGLWGVEVTGTTADGEELDPETPNFNVNVDSFSLSPGDPAPQSVQTLASDVEDIRDIDTSVEPIVEQHNLTIADAVTSGKPTVIAFTTPAFCQTQVCGPVKEVFDDLYAQRKDDANFIHIEPYDVVRMRAGDCPTLSECLSPLLEEWKLPSEPWTFVVDAEGNIAQKFDGIASLEEIDAALAAALAG